MTGQRKVSADALRELVRMHREGLAVREVARRLGMGPNTERRYRCALADEGLLDGPLWDLPEPSALAAAVSRRLPRRPTPQQTSSIAAHSGRVADLMRQGLGPRAIHRALEAGVPGFTGTLSAVKRLCARVSERVTEARGAEHMDARTSRACASSGSPIPT